MGVGLMGKTCKPYGLCAWQIKGLLGMGLAGLILALFLVFSIPNPGSWVANPIAFGSFFLVILFFVVMGASIGGTLGAIIDLIMKTKISVWLFVLSIILSLVTTIILLLVIGFAMYIGSML
jgi:hypothetical protein